MVTKSLLLCLQDFTINSYAYSRRLLKRSSSSIRHKNFQYVWPRVITGSTYDISSSSLLGDLGWNRLSLNRQKQKAILTFKTLHGQTPQYLQQMFTPRSSPYFLRDSNGMQTILSETKNRAIVKRLRFYGIVCLNHSDYPHPFPLSKRA